MQSGNALTVLTGPVGLLLIAGVVCAVFAARAWRSAKAQQAAPETAEVSCDELDVQRIPSRGLRRSTRGPRIYDQEEQERVIRDLASSARGKARAARGQSSKVA